MEKSKNNIALGTVFMLEFILFTILVKYIDVKNIGPKNSYVGFSSLNLWFKNLVGQNMLFYKITKYLGYLSFGIVIYFAIKGLLDLVKKKSLFKVNKNIIATGIFYVILLCFYVLFEKFVINYRPILIDGVLEPSYPSSHTLLSMFLCGSAIIYNCKLNNKSSKKILNVILTLLLVAILGGRIISGVHWLSDIFGSIILSTSLLFYYSYFINKKNVKAS